MTNPPKRMSGTSTLVQWCNQLLEFAKASRVVDSQTVKASYSPKGTTLRAAEQSVSGASTPAAGPVIVYFKQSFGDYLVCSTNADGSGKTVRVAKTPALRNTVVSANLYGTHWTYTYPVRGDNPSTTFLYRVALNTTNQNTENQGVTPSYYGIPMVVALPMAITLINTVSADTEVGAGVAVTFIELSSRAWSQFQNQSI